METASPCFNLEFISENMDQKDRNSRCFTGEFLNISLVRVSLLNRSLRIGVKPFNCPVDKFNRFWYKLNSNILCWLIKIPLGYDLVKFVIG